MGSERGKRLADMFLVLLAKAAPFIEVECLGAAHGVNARLFEQLTGFGWR